MTTYDTRIKILSVLILVAAFPLSAGIIFHSSLLSWTGVAIVGVACLGFAIDLLWAAWTSIHERPSRVARTESKALAEEYLRVGWTLKQEIRGSGEGECSIYLLEWLGDGDPVRVDFSKLMEKKADG